MEFWLKRVRSTSPVEVTLKRELQFFSQRVLSRMPVPSPNVMLSDLGFTVFQSNRKQQFLFA